MMMHEVFQTCSKFIPLSFNAFYSGRVTKGDLTRIKSEKYIRKNWRKMEKIRK